jgi:hypothetical protein
MYGTMAPSSLPLVSWGCWVSRDLLTIGAAFSIPKPLSEFLRQNEIIRDRHRAGLVAQLLPVMLVQVVSTPLHLAANDFYNFKSNAPRVRHFSSRVNFGRSAWVGRFVLVFALGSQ